MRPVVGVLRGGTSHEYDVSLDSGASILSQLNREKYEPRDIFISRSGEWHRGGIVMDPHQALRGVDIAFNVLHGKYGEDGKLQRLLETHHIPYTGAGPFQSAVAYNKHLTKEAAAKLAVKTPRSLLIREGIDPHEESLRIFRSFVMPVMVKPVVGGSSIGVTLARDFHSLQGGIEHALRHASRALIEEYIRGREATVGVIDNFRGEKLYALLPVEIIPPQSSPFFDYSAKYSGATAEICPGNFTQEQKSHLMDAAKKIHGGLDLRHYSRSDFIVSSRGIYFLEVNPAAAVGMTKESLFPKALRAVGSQFSEFLEHIIELTRTIKR